MSVLSNRQTVLHVAARDCGWEGPRINFGSSRGKLTSATSLYSTPKLCEFALWTLLAPRENASACFGIKTKQSDLSIRRRLSAMIRFDCLPVKSRLSFVFVLIHRGLFLKNFLVNLERLNFSKVKPYCFFVPCHFPSSS